MNATPLARHLRMLALAWAALLALMLASLGSAYLRLGVGNVVAGLLIATAKAAIVLWLYMRLRSASPTTRIVAVTALATWLLLVTLSGVDYATRRFEPAAFQSPRQGPAFAGGKTTPQEAR